ncbi:SurA N-terminal domain-containing protein [Orbaceae bacterium ac157xtp]
MMEKIRTAANSVIVKIIFGIIMLAFIFMGMDGLLKLGSNSADDARLYIAKIDGEGISRTAFDNELKAIAQQSRLDASNSSLLEYYKQTLLDMIINDTLTYNLAEELNLKISDNQIKNAIITNPQFFKDGRFNNEYYISLLKQSGLSPTDYAESLRSSMMTQQIGKALTLSDFALPVESEISALVNQKRKVYYADYDLSKVEDDYVASDEEAENFYNEHQESYRHPERLKMDYVINPYPEIEREIKISQGEIQDYYAQNHPITYSKEKRLYSILTFDSKAKADKSYQTLSKLTNTKRIAEKMQNLGWFTNDDLPTLLAQNKLAKPGNITKPIEQTDSYYIVRLDKIEPAKKLPFDYVRKLIAEQLKKEKTDAIYNAQQERLESAAKLGSIDEIAKAADLKVYHSEWTTKNEAFSIGRFPIINNLIFSEEMVKDGKPTGAISDIVYAPEYNSTFIIQVTEFEEEGISPFDEVKGNIKEALLYKHKKELFSEKIESILAELNEKGSAPTIQFAQNALLDRQGTNTTLDKKAIDAVFSIVTNPSTRQGFGAVKLNDTKAQFFSLVKVMDGEVTDMSTEIKGSTTQADQYYLLGDLKSKAKIEYFINGATQ